MTRIVLAGTGGNKYGARKTEYNGRLYHSKREAVYAMELDLRLHAKELISWEPQVTIRLDVNGHHICNYIVDFKLYYTDGRIELVEVKGAKTAVYNLKAKLLTAVYLAEHPEVTYLVVS